MKKRRKRRRYVEPETILYDIDILGVDPDALLASLGALQPSDMPRWAAFVAGRPLPPPSIHDLWWRVFSIGKVHAPHPHVIWHAFRYTVQW